MLQRALREPALTSVFSIMSVDLISLDEYKLYATINSTEQDELIQAAITAVSALVKTYCNRSFVDHYSNPVTQYFKGTTKEFYVDEFPINRVIDVSVSTDYGTTYTTLDIGIGYYVDREVDSVLVPSAPTDGKPNTIRIKYTGGYEQVPEDLKLAVLDIVGLYVRKENVVRKTQGFTSVEYIRTADFPPAIKRVLDLYRSL